MQELNTVEVAEPAAASVLIVENDSFVSLALSTQCSVFGIKCDVRTNSDKALELVESRLCTSNPFYGLVLIDWKSAINMGADVLAQTIYEKVKLKAPTQKLPSIHIMAETSNQLKKAESFRKNPAITSCFMKPIY